MSSLIFMSFSGNPVPARERGTPAGTLSRIVHGYTYSIQSMVTTKFLKRKKRKEGAMQELQRTTHESKHATERTAILAAVVPEKAHPFVLEELDLDEPREDEVLVRVVATGICHTDLREAKRLNYPGACDILQTTTVWRKSMELTDSL